MAAVSADGVNTAAALPVMYMSSWIMAVIVSMCLSIHSCVVRTIVFVLRILIPYCAR